MKWLPVFILLTGCAIDRQESALAEGASIDFRVDCERGAIVRFNGGRNENENQTGQTKTVDPSKLKGVIPK